MNPAEQIIAKFGGQSALAALIEKKQSTVQYWAKKGMIPARWHAELISLAQQHSIQISANDFLPVPSEEEKEIASARIPEAKWWGTLNIGVELPCYVLDDGRRIISRNGATGVLTDKKGGGNLESYIGVEVLKKYLPPDLSGMMVEFSIAGVVNKSVRGMEAETFLEICRAYVKAMHDNAPLTDRQKDIATKASMFLASCAKVGLIALIDEATGYQYDRAQDALQFKFKVFLEEEMRKWEPTFPNELWLEFGRLTNWKGSVNSRPKYWGKLVMELVYGYLDRDIAEWLRKNAPAPRKGQNYHQWLSSQYGLKKLVEHIWMLIGMARACASMRDLRERMAEQFGRQEVQLTLFAPPPARAKIGSIPNVADDLIEPGENDGN